MSNVLALTISLIVSCVSGPALSAGETFNKQVNSSESTSIANSDVYWDLYFAFKDKYLENNPNVPANGFNPYMICPNYGKSPIDGNLSTGDLLLVRPYKTDLYLYLWLNTSDNANYAYQSSIYPMISDNMIRDEEQGYYLHDNFKMYEAKFVNERYFGETLGANWLGKWVIHNYITDTSIDTHRANIQSIYLNPEVCYEILYFSAEDLAEMQMDEHFLEEWAEDNNYMVSFSGGIWTLTSRDISLSSSNAFYKQIECGDEMMYQYSNAENVLNYTYTMPNYVEIKNKTAKLKLSGIKTQQYRSDSIPLFYYDPNNFYEDEGVGLGPFKSEYTLNHAYKYNEIFYCFFDVGDVVINGVKQDQSQVISSMERINYSYNKQTYIHVSSTNRWRGGRCAGPTDACTACYTKTLNNVHLSNQYGDYFSDVTTKYSGVRSVDSRYQIEKEELEWSFLLWKDTKKFTLDGIIQCSSGENGEPSIEDKEDGSNDELINFIKNNRDYDSNGDGIKDKTYRWAFLIDNDYREAVWKDGWSNPLVFYDVQYQSTCHDINDVLILRLKFSFDGDKYFDLQAMDFTTPLDPNPDVGDMGAEYITLNEIGQAIVDWFNANKFSLFGFSSILLLVVIGILFLYFFPYIMPILKGIGKGGKSLKDAIKGANKQYKIDRENKKSIKAPKKPKKSFKPEA